MFLISRYWNRFAYLFVDLGRLMIWDQTKRNSDILSDYYFASEATRDILTSIPRKRLTPEDQHDDSSDPN